MIPLRLADIAEATAGRLVDGADGAAEVTGPVVIDSRLADVGSMFVCLPGERVDGHDFAPAARDAGAVAALAAHPVGVPAVVVADPATALGAIAQLVLRAAQRCRVVGVTGSSGKTSTKDLLAEVYTAAGPVVAPERSFNNEVGLPLTVTRITQDTRTLVAEYSARGVGHIRYLCDIAAPDTAIVLNVGAAHLGEFGSRDAIAKAKGELVEAVDRAGVAVLNADDELVLAMRERTRARVVTFGSGDGADIRIRELTTDELARPRFRLETPSGKTAVRLRLHGAHHAANAAAVTAAALSDGIALDDIVAALERAGARSPHRMDVRHRDDGLVVVDDSYNANPESTRAALDALSRLAGPSRRSWAVLGEMRELGDDSEALHRAVGEHVAATGVDELVVVGAAAPVADGAMAAAGWSGRARVVDDVSAATAIVAAEAGADDVVLVKASNSIALWQVVDALLDGESVEESA